MDLTSNIYFRVFAKLEAEAISLWVCGFVGLRGLMGESFGVL